MSLTASLMLAKAGYNVGKGVFDWLNAKNKKFHRTAEERQAQSRAGNQAALGMGAQGFNLGASQIRRSAADAQTQMRSRAFAGGLENTAFQTAASSKVVQMEQSELADLAVKIADRNATFRTQAAGRKERIDMQIGERRRAFAEQRDREIREATNRTVTSILDFGIKAAGMKEANATMAATGAENAKAGKYMEELAQSILDGDAEKRDDIIKQFQDEEWDFLDIGDITAKFMAIVGSDIKRTGD